MELNNQVPPNLSKQYSLGIWLTGLSGAGKSTIAEALKQKFEKLGIISVIIDGDELRNTINKNLGFSPEDRKENVRMAAEIAALLIRNNIIAICSFMSPSHEMRTIAKEIIGEEKFYEVYVKATIESCSERDVKGLYARSAAGQLHNMIGIDSIYEEPKEPQLILDTNELSVAESSQILYEKVMDRILKN